MQHILEHAHEITGTGTIFPDREGTPLLHMHIACGRETQTKTGCIRRGVRTWNLLEVIIQELIETTATRALDPSLGFNVLNP